MDEEKTITTERPGMKVPTCRDCGAILAHCMVAVRGFCGSCWANRCHGCACKLSGARMRLLHGGERFYCEGCWRAKRLSMRVVGEEIAVCIDALLESIRDLAARGMSAQRIAFLLDRGSESERDCGMSVEPMQVEVLARRNGITVRA